MRRDEINGEKEKRPVRVTGTGRICVFTHSGYSQNNYFRSYYYDMFAQRRPYCRQRAPAKPGGCSTMLNLHVLIGVYNITNTPHSRRCQVGRNPGSGSV